MYFTSFSISEKVRSHRTFLVSVDLTHIYITYPCVLMLLLLSLSIKRPLMNLQCNASSENFTRRSSFERCFFFLIYLSKKRTASLIFYGLLLHRVSYSFYFFPLFPFHLFFVLPIFFVQYFANSFHCSGHPHEDRSSRYSKRD